MILDGIYSHITSGRRLSLNDASLPYGGLFDKGQRAGRPCHQSHRRGIDIDINHQDSQAFDVRSETTMVNGKSVPLKERLIRLARLLDLYEVPEELSFHLRVIPSSR